MHGEAPFIPFSVLEADLERMIDTALAEDLAMGDVTTDALIHPGLRAEGSVVMKAAGVLAGMPMAAAVFRRVDPTLVFTPKVQDGAAVKPGDVIAEVAGSARHILRGERLALNYLQRMSGVATETAKVVAAVRDLPVRVTETRKTTPGLRVLEKYAVRVGGGHNHRQNLSDGILIKDNHLEALALAGFGVADAVRLARDRAPHTVKVEIEGTDFQQLDEAVAAGADWVLLDNMSPAMMREAVQRVAGRVKLEASGGITLENAREIAETGVDLISSGSFTHSYKALDISMKLSYRVK
jgi:nicotinate-nucleotide pyrophosphorylase (carboxylating)